MKKSWQTSIVIATCESSILIVLKFVLIAQCDLPAIQSSRVLFQSGLMKAKFLPGVKGYYNHEIEQGKQTGGKQEDQFCVVPGLNVIPYRILYKDFMTPAIHDKPPLACCLPRLERNRTRKSHATVAHASTRSQTRRPQTATFVSPQPNSSRFAVTPSIHHQHTPYLEATIVLPAAIETVAITNLC